MFFHFLFSSSPFISSLLLIFLYIFFSCFSSPNLCSSFFIFLVLWYSDFFFFTHLLSTILLCLFPFIFTSLPVTYLISAAYSLGLVSFSLLISLLPISPHLFFTPHFSSSCLSSPICLSSHYRLFLLFSPTHTSCRS